MLGECFVRRNVRTDSRCTFARRSDACLIAGEDSRGKIVGDKAVGCRRGIRPTIKYCYAAAKPGFEDRVVADDTFGNGEGSCIEKDTPAVDNPDPVRKITKYFLIIVAVLFIWYVVADRIAPWTDQARVQAYVIPIVPQVSGRVIDVSVVKDQVVDPGHVLLKIDPTDYELAVQAAEAALELAGQEIGAGTATVTTAQAKLVEAITNLEHAKTQSARVFELEKKNVMSKAEGDKARAVVKQAMAQVDSARAELDKAKQALGVQGEANPRIRTAIADLKKAQLDLSRTAIIAPSKGGITNLQVEEGYYASAGIPLMTFIEFDNVWIQANMRENNIANIAVSYTHLRAHETSRAISFAVLCV